MYQKFTKALKHLHKEQKGITGLETAIILIAFVTVASVLAYSVLSAGIFSAERGKETVYRGLESAQSTLEIKGSVLGISDNETELNDIQFNQSIQYFILCTIRRIPFGALKDGCDGDPLRQQYPFVLWSYPGPAGCFLSHQAA